MQGERSAKEKLKVFRFALPSRSLSWRSKEVQGERSAKEKLKVFRFELPSRSLSWRSKEVQGERSAKEKLKDIHNKAGWKPALPAISASSRLLSSE
ncbi:MAG: hypothetical protein PUB53_07475 [Bacteroidales bacterium]|nr:hypothetical protein [Bacteroidales bacterium]